jgi:diguanylate cyclase (GGDEF)-like protein
MSVIPSRLKRGTVTRDWPWLRLPHVLRWYVAAPPIVAAVLACYAAAGTHWRVWDLVKFSLLMGCGIISVASTPRIMYSTGGLTADFGQIWVLPIAILLPPVYAALVPIPFFVVMQLWVHRGVIYRRVFTAASVSLSYALVSMLFRLFPSSVAGGTVGSGLHAFTWALIVAVCEIACGRVQHFLIVGAVKLSDPRVRIREMELNRETLQGAFVALDLGVLITLTVALSPALVVLALPTVFLTRRFLIHPALVAQSRVDAKTNLLNVTTWEKEAESELSRSIRTRSPLALALVDIDLFKTVNDTHGHLVGDRVLKAVADVLSGQSRDYDRAGRFGGEEFVLLLAQTAERDACRIAERLRAYVSDMKVPVSDAPGAPCVSVTISIGVTAMLPGRSRELADMLAAADSALYQAKQSGRNKVCVASRDQRLELEAGLNGHMEVPVVVPPAASLCPSSSLYALATARRDFEPRGPGASGEPSRR